MLGIKIVGKSKEVFAKVKLMADKAATLTIGELVRLNK